MNVIHIYDAYRYCINIKSQIYKKRKGAKQVSEFTAFLRNEITLIFFLFQRYPTANINMHISIKSICDWSMCLTAPADERLVYVMQTSLHCTISFMNRYIATVTQNWIIAMSLLTYTVGPTLQMPPPLSSPVSAEEPSTTDHMAV